MFSQKKSNEATVTWRSMMPTYANICSAHFFSKAVIELLYIPIPRYRSPTLQIPYDDTHIHRAIFVIIRRSF
jgi:hypothetical protein